MRRVSRTTLVVLAAGLAAMLVVSVRAAGDLPDTAIVDGRPLPRAVALTTAPAMLLLTVLPAMFAQPLRRRVADRLGIPLWRSDENDRRAVELGVTLLVPLFAGLHLFMIGMARGDERFGLTAVALAVGLIMTAIGNALPTAPPQSDLIVEFPLLDRVLVEMRRAYRGIGTAMMLLGLIATGLALVNTTASIVASFLATLVMSVGLGAAVVRGVRVHLG